MSETQAHPEAEPDSLAGVVRQALAGEARGLDRALMMVSPRLLARIDRRLPADVRAGCGPEDVLQEAFTDAFRAFPTFSPAKAADAGESFFRWLCTIAEHRIVDVVRAQRSMKRGGGGAGEGGEGRDGVRGARALRAEGGGGGNAAQSTLSPLIELLGAHSWTPSRSASGHEVEAALRTALDTLFPAYREALELRYLLGLTPAEVAKRLGRTEDAVHKLCGRAIGALREAMGDPANFISRTG